jgi:hypothetical protein
MKKTKEEDIIIIKRSLSPVAGFLCTCFGAGGCGGALGFCKFGLLQLPIYWTFNIIIMAMGLFQNIIGFLNL